MKNKRIKLVLFISIFIFLVFGATGIFFATHSLQAANHEQEFKFTAHGMTTATRLNQADNEKIPYEDLPLIRVSFKGNDTNMLKNMVRKLSSFEGIKDVYPFLSVATTFGEMLGVDVSKDPIWIPADELVVPQVIEGRMLTAEDDGKYTMVAGDLFAREQKTKDGYMILGRLAYHPESVQLGEYEMSVVGVFSGSEALSNTIIMPLSTLETMLAADKDLQNYQIYLWAEDAAKVDEVLPLIKKETENVNSIQVKLIKNGE